MRSRRDYTSLHSLRSPPSNRPGQPGGNYFYLLDLKRKRNRNCNIQRGETLGPKPLQNGTKPAGRNHIAKMYAYRHGSRRPRVTGACAKSRRLRQGPRGETVGSKPLGERGETGGAKPHSQTLVKSGRLFRVNGKSRRFARLYHGSRRP